MSSMSSVAGLSKYIRTFPNTTISISSMIFISFIAGTLIFLINPVGNLTIVEKILYGGAFGFGTFGISSILAGALIQQFLNSMKGINFKTKHSMLLALISMIILTIIAIIGSIISTIFHLDLFVNSIIFACVLIFAFIIFVLWSTSSIGLIKSAITASIQPLLVLAMFVVITFLGNAEQLFEFGIISVFTKLIIANIIFLLAIYSFIKVIESPLKKNLGVGLLELLSYLIAHIDEGSNYLEKIFENMGEAIDTLVGIVSFKGKNGIKCLFISPCVHPGPLGDIGGSNMPTILANRFEYFTMVVHGPSTHDFNPVSKKEIDKIEHAIKKGLSNIEYNDSASKFKRYNEKNAKVGVQFFNKGMLILNTFAPNGSDDIEFGVGLSIMAQSRKHCNVENSIIVDCHNSFNAEKGRVLPGNPEVFQLLDAIDKINCENNHSSKIRVGCSENLMKNLDKSNGIGESGLKIMIIEVENQKTAYILFDSNNMEIGFREEIIKEIKNLDIDEVEVMTTDTHSVNTLSNGYNPIGLSKRNEIMEYVEKCINIAIDDLEEVQVGTSTKRIKGLNTFGPNNSIELISTISSIVAVSKIIAPIIFILAIFFVLIWIFYLP